MRIAPEGWPTLALMAAVLSAPSLGLWWLWPGSALVTAPAVVLLLAWGLWFFRDPIRRVPNVGNLAELVISPADGRVIKIDTAPVPADLRERAAAAGLTGSVPRVSIFLNLFNVHVNRVPAGGRIAALSYVPGRFFNASLDKASTHNERSAALLIDASGRAIVFVQIAGLVARRIVNHLREGQSVCAGERFGLIRFGSRAEVYLPVGSTVGVRVGDFVVAGESVLGTMARAQAGAEPSVHGGANGASAGHTAANLGVVSGVAGASGAAHA